MSSPRTQRRPTARGRERGSFETVYRANVGAISAYFARRSTDPHTVADLTADTFVRAISSLATFEGRGSVRAWLFAIARAVYAQHCQDLAEGRVTLERLTGLIDLDDDELADLADRIDAQQAGRELIARAAQLPELERSALELVDLAGLSPGDAAAVLHVPPGTLRVRLHRARNRLRREAPRP